MANFIGKMLDALKLNEEFDDDDYEGFDEEEELDPIEVERLEQREKKRHAKEERKAARQHSYQREEEDDYREPEVAPMPKRTSFRTASNKVVPIHTTSRGSEICVIRPNNFGDSQDACEMLMQGHAVVVILEGIDIMEAQRIMDFISGCVFSISGKMHQISRYIFIFSPENVDVSGDYLELSQADEFNIPALNKEF